MSQHGRVTKPGRQRPRVPIDERLRAPRACQACQRSKNKCALVSPTGRQCTRCQRKSLDCSFGIGQGHNTPSSISEHNVISIAGQNSPVIDENLEQEESPFSIPQEAQSDGAPPHPDSAAEHLSHLLSRVREAMYGGAGSTRQGAPYYAEQDSNTDQGRFRELLSKFPPKPVADFLSSCCYELATDSFFYFDQQEFQRKLDEVYQDESSRLRENGVFLCLVLMVFALGSQFANLKRKASTAYNPGASRCPGKYFYSVASRLLPMATFDCSIQAMQACLVTAVYLLPEHVYDRAYLYLNHALRIAISLDMHRQKIGNEGSCRDSEIKHRLWWSVFSLDRTVSIKLGRPASIATSEIRTPLPKALLPLDDVQYFDNVSHQIANAKLVLIMDAIINHATPNTITASESLQRIEHQQRDLVSWTTGLASNLKLSNLRPLSKGYRAVIHLHLNFYFASILLCRSALLYLLRRDLKNLFENLAEPDVVNVVDYDRLERLADDCVDAGKAIIDLFETLQQNESLGMFSFTDFQGCSIATVILLLESMRRGNRTNSLSIDTGFSCLRYMATENRHAKAGIQYVEELRVIANQVIQKRMQPSSIHQDDRLDSRGIDAYQDWVQTVIDGSLTPNTSQDALAVEPDGAASILQNYARSPVHPESSFHSGRLSHELGQLTAASESENFTLPPAFQFTAPTTSLPDDISDTFLFGLTGLDALDFLVADGLLQE